MNARSALTPALSLGESGNVVTVGVGEAVPDEVLCCVHAMVDFDAGGLVPHCFREEARDVFTVFGETDDVLL